MKKPKINCPACKEVYTKASTTNCIEGSEYVVICGIIYEQFEKGASNFENYTVVPSHCKEYTKCHIWREEKEADWQRKTVGKYSSFEQAEKIRA